MKNELAKWELSSFIFSTGLGTFLHFVYEWSGDNKFVGIFSAVNESTWEHLKLLFVPFTLFALIEYFFIGKQYQGYFTVKATSIIIGMFSITAIFYTYSGIIGKNFLIADILVFFIGGFLASWYCYKFMGKSKNDNTLGIIILLVLSVCFAVFTFSSPRINLFIDPRYAENCRVFE